MERWKHVERVFIDLTSTSISQTQIFLRILILMHVVGLMEWTCLIWKNGRRKTLLGFTTNGRTWWDGNKILHYLHPDTCFSLEYCILCSYPSPNHLICILVLQTFQILWFCSFLCIYDYTVYSIDVANAK